MLLCKTTYFSAARVCLYIIAVGLLSKSTKGEESETLYPQDALQCYSTSSANKIILCPEDRNNFCIKEVVDSKRRQCGESDDYPMDTWDIKEPGGLCVYKKCSSFCPNTTIIFDNNGEENSRYSLCCDDDLCNSANKLNMQSFLILSVLVIFAVSV